MTVPLLLRAAATSELVTEGRTLTGMSMPFDKASSVSDDGGRTRYLESFDKRSHDVSLQQGGPTRPLFVLHQYNRLPIGTSDFRRSDTEGGIMYEGHASRTRDADEALELVKDGAMTSVSEAFKPINAEKRRTGAGVVTHRTEVAVRELSLAPTGFGQHPDARVYAVRQLAEDAHARLRDATGGDPTDPDRDPALIAQAIDATNDAAAAALAAGDVASAAALLAALDLAVDHLLELFAVPDADDPDETDDAPAATSPEADAMMAAAAPGRAALAEWLRATPSDVMMIGRAAPKTDG